MQNIILMKKPRQSGEQFAMTHDIPYCTFVVNKEGIKINDAVKDNFHMFNYTSVGGTSFSVTNVFNPYAVLDGPTLDALNAVGFASDPNIGACSSCYADKMTGMFPKKCLLISGTTASF